VSTANRFFNPTFLPFAFLLYLFFITLPSKKKPKGFSVASAHLTELKHNDPLSLFVFRS